MRLRTVREKGSEWIGKVESKSQRSRQSKENLLKRKAKGLRSRRKREGLLKSKSY